MTNERPVKDADIRVTKWLEKEIDFDEKDEASYQAKLSSLTATLRGMPFSERARLPFVLHTLQGMEENGSRREPRLARIKETLRIVREALTVNRAKEDDQSSAGNEHTPQGLMLFFGSAWLPAHEKEIAESDEDGFERIVESLHGNLVKHEQEEGCREAGNALIDALEKKMQSLDQQDEEGAALYLRYFELAAIVRTFTTRASGAVEEE